MKTKHWMAALLLTVASVGENTTNAAEPPRVLAPRTDINPAVLYWQAFSLYPDLPEDLRKDFLAEPPRVALADAEPLVKKLDEMFKYLRRATRMKVPCDWGIDFSDGPSTIIPNIIKIRQSTQAGRTRAHYALAAGRDQEAVDDLVAVVVLGRNAGMDGTLVSTMIGIAVEEQVIKFVAENFYRFSPPALISLVKQIDAARPRPTVKQAMATERAVFWEWFIAQFEKFRAAHPTDDRQALSAARDLLASVLGGTEKVDEMIRKSGGTTAGLLDYFKQLEPHFQAIDKLAEASPTTVDSLTEELATVKSRHPNLLAGLIIPNFGRARKTEMIAIARSTMLRAAVALRLHGEEAFQKVTDPFGSGPFTLRRLPQGDEVGFELESNLGASGIKATQKFLEDEPAGQSVQRPKTPKVSYE